MSDLRKIAEQYIRPGTVVNVDIETTAILVDLLRQALAQPEQEPYGYFGYDFRLDAWIQNPDDIRGIPFYTKPPNIEAAVLAEREACAKLCDEQVDAEYATGKIDHNEMGWTQACAIAIRARGEKNT